MAKTKAALKVNRKFIEKLKAALRAAPEKYDQSLFSPEKIFDCDGRLIDPNACSTAVCLAGHAYLLTGKTMAQLSRADGLSIRRTAAQAMGFTIYETSKLFGLADGWPDPFTFADDVPHRQQVSKACAYLDTLADYVEAKRALEAVKAKYTILRKWSDNSVDSNGLDYELY